MRMALSTRMVTLLGELGPRVAATAQKNASENTIDLSLAENELHHDYLQKRILEGIEETTSGKPKEIFALPTAFGGDPKVLSALAEFFNTHFNPSNEVLPEHIALTAGAGNGIETLIQSICDDGDRIVIPEPYWFGFEPYISGRPKVKIIGVPCPNYRTHEKDLLSSLESTLENISHSSKTKALVICNPQNPLSRCYPKDVILGCIDLCQKHGLHFISDEIYALTDIGPEDKENSRFLSALSVSSVGENSPQGLWDTSRIHVVWSPSKLFGLSGLRIGCVVSQQNPSIRAAVSFLTYAGTSTLSAAALTALLRTSSLPGLLHQTSKLLSASYSIFAQAFDNLEIEYIPATVGLFVFARIANSKSIEEDKQLTADLESQGLCFSPGWLYDEHCSESGWRRITIAVSEETAVEAVSRLKSYLQCGSQKNC